MKLSAARNAPHFMIPFQHSRPMNAICNAKITGHILQLLDRTDGVGASYDEIQGWIFCGDASERLHQQITALFRMNAAQKQYESALCDLGNAARNALT